MERHLVQDGDLEYHPSARVLLGGLSALSQACCLDLTLSG